MRLRTKAASSLLAVLCLAIVFAASAAAQTVTTGNIAGSVTDAQGGVLPGATVTAVHTSTGTSYEAVVGADGRFSILNVRVGPYTISAAMIGFKEQRQENVDVALGQERTIEFKLPLATVSETVEVLAQSPQIDLSRAGTADNISNQIKENLPTITRSLTDIARISPLFVAQGSGAGDGPAALSVAGNSYRYNSLQIDGAINNDLFGLAASAGTPGGTAETQPISLDAIQEVQLVVTPYDVRQGGFSGGGINAITKSGTNDIHGTAFFFGRNQDWVGKGVSDTKISTLKDKQGGGSLGGPIVTNKVFYFGTAEWARKQRPTGFCVTGCGQTFTQPALFDRYINDLKNIYGYTPGTSPDSEFPKETDSDKYFVRGDFNLPRNNQLTIRNNYINGFNDISSVSTTAYRTPDAFYRYVSKVNSTVGQLNSQFGKGVNELRLTYTRGRDHRESPIGNPPFPQVTVQLTPTVSVVSGTEQFSARNAIDQDIMELNDAYTVLKGRHTVTIGTHNEFLNLKNLFIRDNFGTYRFSTARELRGGPRAAVRPQLLRDERSAPARGLQGESVGLLRGRFVAGAVEHDRYVWHSTRRADLPDQAERQSGFGRQLRLCHRRRPEPRRVVAARWHQLRPEWQGHPADSWRHRPVHGTAGVRVDFESVRQHRHRLHAHRRRLPAGERDDAAEQHSVHYRSAEPAEQGDRRPGRHVHERDRHDRSQLQVPVGAARQPRLRPPVAVGLDRRRRLRLVEHRQRHQVPEPELRAGARGHGRRRPAVLHPQGHHPERRHPPGEHQPGLLLQLRLRSPASVQERAVRAGLVFVRRGQVDHGWHLRPGGLELGLRLRPGQRERRAAGAFELRSGTPHHADRQLRHAICEGDQARRVDLLLGAVGPAVHAASPTAM